MKHAEQVCFYFSVGVFMTLSFSLDKYWSINVLIITISSRFHQYFPNKGREQIKREAEKVNEMEEERK